MGLRLVIDGYARPLPTVVWTVLHISVRKSNEFLSENSFSGFVLKEVFSVTIINSVQQSPFSEVNNNLSVDQDSIHCLWNPDKRYCSYKGATYRKITVHISFKMQMAWTSLRNHHIECELLHWRSSVNTNQSCRASYRYCNVVTLCLPWCFPACVWIAHTHYFNSYTSLFCSPLCF
jgi:hypothetical protein